MQHFQTLVPAVADHLKIASQMPPIQVPKDLLNAMKLGITHGEAHLQGMLQAGANERQLRPQILQQRDLEKMYIAKSESGQGRDAGCPDASDGGAKCRDRCMALPVQGQFAGGPGPSGPMGIPLGANAAHLGLNLPGGAAPPINPFAAAGGAQWVSLYGGSFCSLCRLAFIS
jgi:hypothetical protein